MLRGPKISGSKDGKFPHQRGGIYVDDGGEGKGWEERTQQAHVVRRYGTDTRHRQS